MSRRISIEDLLEEIVEVFPEIEDVAEMLLLEAVDELVASKSVSEVFSVDDILYSTVNGNDAASLSARLSGIAAG